MEVARLVEDTLLKSAGAFKALESSNLSASGLMPRKLIG